MTEKSLKESTLNLNKTFPTIIISFASHLKQFSCVQNFGENFLKKLNSEFTGCLRTCDR